MIEAVLVFLILLLVAAIVYAAAGWVGLPHPIPAACAGIVVIIAVIYLVSKIDTVDAVLRL